MKVICFDLDDTLYKEIDYLNSAYKEIAEYAAEHCHGCSDPVQILAIKAYMEMLSAYEKGDNAFERLNAFLGLSLPISDYLTIYRQHKPNIELSKEVFETLSKLRGDSLELRDKKRGDSSITVSDPLIDENVEIRLGLITDGRSLQQRNKIEALGLNRFFDDEDIIISEEFGSEKPSAANYEYFMKKYPDAEYTYVGDNPKKDFIGANALGWNTVCLLDVSLELRGERKGRNIHKQDFSLPEGYLPKVKIGSLNEIIKKYKKYESIKSDMEVCKLLVCTSEDR